MTPSPPSSSLRRPTPLSEQTSGPSRPPSRKGQSTRLSGSAAASLAALEETRAAAEEAGVEAAGPIEDLDGANELVAALDAAAAADPPVEGAADLVAEATAAIEEGSDPDGDGLSTGAENEINGQIEAAITATTPTGITLVTLDPTNPASVGGEPDATTANTLVGNLESLSTTLSVTEQNQDSRPRDRRGRVSPISRNPSSPSSIRSISPGWRRRWHPRPRRQSAP